MSFLDKFIGNVAASPIKAIGNVFDKLFTSDEERLKAKAVLEKLKQHPSELQVELNKLEAQHRSIWVAGWRPFIGWVCGISLGCFFIPQFILAAYLWMDMCLKMHKIVPYPVTPSGLHELVYALLGLGLYRTFEKFTGKSK